MNSSSTQIFEAERAALFSIAYRMLGERAAAEDVVQDTWLRWSAQNLRDIENPAAWLKRVTARIAIDVLRSARSKRETYVGPWLPDALLSEVDSGPETHLELAQQCELALLWAMERLSPEERAAFILRTAFDADYEELAEALGKSEASCRQLVSRARKRVASKKPRHHVSTDEKSALLLKFAQACMAGDQSMVLSLLAPDVVAVSDGGGKVRAALRPLEGKEEVATVSMAVAQKAERMDGVRLVFANGNPALAILEGGEHDMIYTLSANENGLIDWIYVVRNPEKLDRVKLQSMHKGASDLPSLDMSPD